MMRFVVGDDRSQSTVFPRHLLRLPTSIHSLRQSRRFGKALGTSGLLT
jgi:hypothetical protein